MKGTRHSPEQIIAKLREAEAKPASGASIGQVCQQLGGGDAARLAGRSTDGLRARHRRPPPATIAASIAPVHGPCRAQGIALLPAVLIPPGFGYNTARRVK